MPEPFDYDVFLSHNRGDKPRVLRLAERLRREGLRVWLDDWVVRPGDDIYLEIERGLEASRTLILCMSPAAFGSHWVGLERSTVLFRDPANQDRRFIPLLLAECDLPDTLRRFKYVDYRDEGDVAFHELLAACRAETEAAASIPEPSSGEEPQAAEPLAVLERKLEGHHNWVMSVAVSPDGKWAVSGSEDRTVKIWDLETGECRDTLTKHKNHVRSVAITPDGRRILSSSADRTIKVWDVRSGHCTISLSAQKWPVDFAIPFTDGRRVLSGSDYGNIRLWAVDSGDSLATLHGKYGDGICCAAVSQDGKRAVSGDAGGRIAVWNLETGEYRAMLQRHRDIVRSVQITPDGRQAISASDDGTAKLWEMETGRCVGTFEGHRQEVYSVAISPDGTLVASAGIRGWIQLWDLKSAQCLQVIELEANQRAASVTFHPDGSRLLAGTGYLQSGICIYRLADVKSAVPAEVSPRYVNAKVVLLGEGEVGKSGLAHRLIEDKFVRTHSTHGMQVWRLDLPIEQEDGAEREALLWDLAGQEDYRLIHQLFLDETALALVLINPQKDDPFAEVGDWLEALGTAVTSRGQGREVVKLLVAARTDVGTVKVSQRKIDRFLEERGFAAYLPTSARRGDNCSDRKNKRRPSALKQLIAGNIPWDTLPWTATPRLLRELKNAVVAMTEDEEVRLLRFPELVQRLKRVLPGEHFDEGDARTAVTLLANHGLVMPFGFGDLVLLQPHALNGYASAVIRAARAHVDEIGCVAEQHVFDCKIDFEGVDRLAPADEELLLRAMVRTFLDK
ncbi:MAG: TIR domain-containing protein, partial [bacterium]|nr:TIR domain-containing protein [bacterium]